MCGIDWPFFLENDCITEQVPRRLLGPAEAEGGTTRERDSVFRLWERAARPTERGTGRDSRWGGVRGPFPFGGGERRRDQPWEAVAKRPACRKKHDFIV